VRHQFAIGLPARTGNLADSLRSTRQSHAVRETGRLKIPFPVLAGLQAGVAVPSQYPRQRRDVANQVVGLRPRLTVFLGSHLPHRRKTGRRMIEVDAMLVRVKAGENRRQRRSADTHRYVAVPVDRRLRSQPVDVRRVDQVVAHEAEIAVRLVIGQNENHVRRRRLRLNRVGREQPIASCS